MLSRKRLAGRDASAEVQLVLENLLESWSLPESSGNEADLVTICHKTGEETNKGPQPRPNRDQLKVTVKLFLTNFGDAGLRAGLEAAMAKIDTDHVETLFVAVPVNAMEVIGVGSGSNPEQAEAQVGKLRKFQPYIL